MMANNLKQFYYVYVLLSLRDGNKYTGYTKDLPSRFEAHQKGKVNSTKHRIPFKLLYFEGCISQKDALKREKYLKTHYGKMFLGNRLKSYFTCQEKIEIKL
jgi:putative endonuclease